MRLAQGRDAEAETLVREALEIVEATDFRGACLDVLDALGATLSERGRLEEAEALRGRVAEFQPKTARQAAVADSAFRIA